MAAQLDRITEVLKKHRNDLIAAWRRELDATGALADPRSAGGDVSAHTERFIDLLSAATAAGGGTDVGTAAWMPVREFLESLSTTRARLGYSSSQTATFIFSFKKPFFAALRKELTDSDELAAQMWTASELLDKLGLITVAAFQHTRESVISRQQQELLELSTPVVKLWEGILALPMIGTLDSARTQVVMESLLQRIVDTGSQIAIIDITGVPTVDTLVAQHLLKTVTAIRLMGADCIVSGVRPQIAQTIVHLGVDLEGVTTKATLADALALALARTGRTVQKTRQ
jgi:rsbT co-antagonist protein RsbR